MLKNTIKGFRLVQDNVINVLQMIFDDKSLSDIYTEELLSDPKVSAAYDEAIETLRNDNKKEEADVIVDEVVKFKVYTTSGL